MREKVILDLDVGVDDALALLLALNSPEIEVLGVTTVSGNVDVEKTSKNALKILEQAKCKEIPVYKGSRKPLLRELVTAEEYHGLDGLGDSGLPEPKLRVREKRAVEYIIEEVMENKGVSIVATAPLTNVALSLLVEPELAKKINRIILMGGAFKLTPYGIGNVTPVAEFNIYVDPEAAEVVFNSGAKITAIGLDVTTKPDAIVREDIYNTFSSYSHDGSKLFKRITEKLFGKHKRIELHDPMAVMYSLKPQLYRVEKYKVDVETTSELTRGETIVNKELKGDIEVAVNVNGEEFLKEFEERVIKVDYPLEICKG
jgi:purine nucleosidase